MKLINHVLDIRRLIQQAFDNRFSRIGLRTSEPVPVEQQNAEQQARRRRLEDIMQSHFSELGDYAQARQAAINECVFTLFNRIAAIKVMESKELFPEIITRRKENAGRSFEHNAWLEQHPEERNAEREGLKHFLADQFAILGEHIPLYRADYPYALMPTADELNEIIDQFNAVEDDPDCGADVWKGDDILGWLYENFNAVEKEALKQSGEKTEYNKVSLQSQVYTPQWVVKFLVDNTLGKVYLEMFPNSAIKEKYQIANAPEHQVRYAQDLRQMRLLDPACGSGNFLIYAFSVFYDLYVDQMEHYGRDYSRRDIPKMIVEHNLFGIDLDERAAQISQIALFIKARELGGHRSHWPAYTNVVSTHFFLPKYEDLQGTIEILGSWSQKQIAAIEQIWNDLSSAYKFGSLIRVEERLNEMMPNDVNESLFKELEIESLFAYKNNVITQLRNNVNQWGGQGSNPFTLAKANDAISFLDIISNKYDVVVANPPYTDSGDFGQELKAFVEDNYRRPMKFNSNLYACFIKRCCELAGDDGKVGMIHPLTFMYIKSFEDIRKYILDNYHINILAELGLGGVFPNAQVDAVMYILEESKIKGDGVFINLTKYKNHTNKPQIFLKVYKNFIDKVNDRHVFLLSQSKLKGIKSYPFIYWISDEFREKFTITNLGKYTNILEGIKTGNNNAALRFHWELSYPFANSEYWCFYTKGGPYNKWYGNIWTCVNRGDDFALIKSQSTYNIPAIKYKMGITYSKISSKGTDFRLLEEDTLYDSGACSIFTDVRNIWVILSIVNTSLIKYVCECLNPTVNTVIQDIRRLPFLEAIPQEKEHSLEFYAKQCVSIKKYLCRYSLVEPLFKESPIIANGDVIKNLIAFFENKNALMTLILLNEVVVNDIVFDIYELSENDKQMVIDKEGIPVGNLPVSHKAKMAYRQWLIEESDFTPSDELLAYLDALEESEDLLKINNFDTLYQSNNEWEEFCIKHEMNPVEVWWQFKNANVLPPQRTQVLAFELITDVIRSVLAKDNDGIIPLGDKMGEERLAIRVEREMMERGYSVAQFSQICQLLGCGLEKYLQEFFFSQLCFELDLFKYLPATPFIWHITSGEHHAIELYVSIYKWNRNALFRVRSIYAANREAALRDRLNSIDTSNTEGRMEVQELRAMLTELQEFCHKVDDLLASGYDPKLDDGVGKNIAPLQKRKMLSYEVLNAGQLKKYLNADW